VLASHLILRTPKYIRSRVYVRTVRRKRGNLPVVLQNPLHTHTGVDFGFELSLWKMILFLPGFCHAVDNKTSEGSEGNNEQYWSFLLVTKLDQNASFRNPKDSSRGLRGMEQHWFPILCDVLALSFFFPDQVDDIAVCR
jgi:hypothetical protein